MPRASTDTKDEAPKRAPRKRAVRRTVTKAETPVRRTRTTRTATRVKEEVETVASVRRAPTPFAAKAEASGVMRKRIIIMASFFVFVSGVAAFIGFSDDGQIDVSSRINEANSRTPVATQEVTSEGDVANDGNGVIPVQNNTPPAAISGLRGRGVGTPPVTQESTPATDQSTTTDEEVDSSEDGTGEVSTETQAQAVVEEGGAADTTSGE